MEAKTPNPSFKLELILEAKTILLEYTQTYQNQFHTSKSLLSLLKIESKPYTKSAVDLFFMLFYMIQW
jgi:hypothetical protein